MRDLLRCLVVMTLLALGAGMAHAQNEARVAESRRKLAASKGGTPLPPPAETKDTSEVFEVGAQFRGVAKKTFHELGTGTLGFRTVSQDTFAVSLDARVKNPDTQELIECKIQRQYKLVGKSIKKLSENDWFNQAGEKYKKRFIDCVSLGYLVKWATPREDKGPFRELTYTLDGMTYGITYTRTDRWLECTIRGRDGVVGKFFLLPVQGGVRPVDKFRIFARDQLVVSFVSKRSKEPTSPGP
jgi:hypothetical protein